ncbi:metal-dependent transcriptional regulator [Chthonomonas calidirosea]|uniref:metal-dependent transcriptional regulator n=1 Tax=Chthonomonas calidirosea TaxID=454171 RepID=UPI0006EC5220|nr:metal-dependent transcriptional regulator [Chthonomonas calidirosea]CEK17953.1 iron (metal) dependent repressor, DtxR family [Chthonomonas calidirosea]
METQSHLPGQSVEDYLKAIYNMEFEGLSANTADLASRLNVSAPAVSKMLRRLTELQLVEHTPYHAIQLTERGRKVALEIIRHHRLLERYLVDALGYSWEEVHAEAERLEHHISEDFESRIDDLLGHPTTCPHGAPIPSRNLVVTPSTGRPLSEMAIPGRYIVDQVVDEDPVLLRYLKERDLVPGSVVALLEREPFGGDFTAKVGQHTVRIAPKAAAQVFVLPFAEPTKQHRQDKEEEE